MNLSLNKTILSLVLLSIIAFGCEKKTAVEEIPTVDHDLKIAGDWERVISIERIYNDSQTVRTDTTKYTSGQKSINFQSGKVTFSTFKSVEKIMSYTFDGTLLTLFDTPASDLTTEKHQVTIDYDTMFTVMDAYYSDGKDDYRRETKITWAR